MDLYFHVSEERHGILRPTKNDNYEECICLSLNCFISYLGQYVYIFDRATLDKTFHVREIATSGYAGMIGNGYQGRSIRFKGQSLGNEYRIYDPIDVEKFAIGVFEHFNHTRGIVEQYLDGELMSSIRTDVASKRTNF